jgi:hypothetical protein
MKNKMKNLKQIYLTIIIATFLFTSCSSGYVGFYGFCGFDNYPITVKKDGSFTINHGNINPWSYGKWEKASGGIMVTGLTGDDSNDNGLWKDGKDDALISPSGGAYCKSGLSPD